MKVLKFALIGAVFLTGCSFNRVKFDETKPDKTSRFRTISAEQRLCEVEKQLALFTDENKNLWLNCPYRYEGRTIQSLAYIGPKPRAADTDFVQDAASQKIKSLKKEALRNCGKSRYCADLSQYGYMDFSIQFDGTKARINYGDLSDGFKDLERFYANLDGTATLDPQLGRLVDSERVVEKIERISTLKQYRNVFDQLKSLGLTDDASIQSSLESKHAGLEIAEFRQQGNFSGYQSAFRLTGERSDFEYMRNLAKTDEEKSSVFSTLIQNYKTAPLAETLQTAGKFVSTARERAELDDLLKSEELKQKAQMKRQAEAKLAEKIGGLFYDENTGLAWRRCSLGRAWDSGKSTCTGEPEKAAWLNMVELAAKDTYGGLNDWRLPTKAELNNLIGKFNNCGPLQVRVTTIFPGQRTRSYFESYHWLLDNSDDMKDPSSADLEVVTGMLGCKFINNDLRPHAPQPAVLVRGGAVPAAWKVALSKTPQAQALFNQSKKAGVAMVDATNSTMANVMTNIFGDGKGRSSGTSSSSSDSSGNSSAAWKILKKYEGGFSDFGFDLRSTIYVVRCGSGSEKKIYQDKKGLWGTVGLGGNNASSSLDDAANKYCK